MNEHVGAKLLLKTLGIALSVIPVAVCTLMYFPLWQQRGASYTLSGFTLFLLVLCAVPLLKAVKRILASASAPLMWLIIFALFFMMSRIADEMVIISFVGFVGNLLGAVAFKIEERLGRAKNERT